MDGVDFPRGRYATFKDSLAKKVPKRPAEDELFSTRAMGENSDDDSGAQKIAKKKKQKVKKVTSDEVSIPGLPDFSEKIMIYRLKASNVAIGSIVLACVTQIKDFEMSVQLPGAVMVRIAITNISDAYSKALSLYASDPAKNPAPPKPKSLFKLGDLLPVKILDKKDSSHRHDDTPMNLVDIEGSINPRDIYSNLNASTFVKNCLHSCISAAVVEIEDNGYLMDIGKENIHGFLSFENAEPFLESHEMEKLQVGQVLMANIASATQRVIKLTTKSVPTKSRSDEIESNFPASCLVPGLQVKCKVLAVNESGLDVVIFGQHRGFVHRDHLKTIWDLPRDDYTIGSELSGIILFVNPITKVSSVSLRSVAAMSALQKTWSQLKVGQLIEDSKIVGRDSGEAFIFKFPNGFKGIAPKGELSDEYVDSEEFSIMEGKMPIGSSHKCRIKSLSYLDGCAKVTLKASLLKEELLSVDNLSIGQVIDGRVKKLSNKGLIVNLGFGIKAICPLMHLKDSAKSQDYKAGSKIKCRIVRLDTSSLLPRIAVTCKKEIIRETKIIDDISKAEPGTFTHGVVALIQPTGLLVEFFNNLRGWLSATRLSKEGQQYIPSLYTVGQVLPVYVAGCDRKAEQIHLSLTYTEDESYQEDGSAPLGTVLKDLTVKEKDDNGFVLIDKDRTKYYLPKSQLTDFPALADKIYQAIDETDTIDEVVIYNNTPGIPVVSRRYVFIQAAKIESPVFKPDSLNPDLIVPAVIVNFKCYGIMVECPGGLIGLVPNSQISDPPVDPFEVKIPKEQTILVHINEVKSGEDQPRRLNCSTIIAQCQSPDFRPEMMLASYLFDYRFVASKLHVLENTSLTRTLSTVKPGDIVSYKVIDNIKDQTLVACTVSGRKKAVPGIIIAPNLADEDSDQIGASGEAVALYIDIEKKVIHLSANLEIVKNAKSAIKGEKYSQVRPDHKLVGLVQLITDKFYIVSLRGHGIGVLAHIPRFHHFNQLKLESCVLCDGQKLYFNVKFNQVLNDESIVIVGSKTVEKPTGVQNKEEQAKLSKIKKKLAKRERRKAANEKPKKQTKDSDDKENGDEEVDEADSDDDEDGISDSDDETVRFIIDEKGNLKRLRTTSQNEEGSDSDGDGTSTRSGNKRKRKVSESRDVMKEQKKKHFKKIQSSISNRVKSAVADEKEMFFWDTTGDSNLIDNDEDSNEVQTSKKVTIDEPLDDEEGGPLTKEEFEKLIVETPNDIDRWCRHINYYFGRNEITKAKELCERALETIDHKNESGKLRIWSLKLKIEYKHGSPESLDELIKTALCANDELKIYYNLIALYEQDNKSELVEQTYKEVTKKHPLNKTLWTDLGRFYLKHGRVNSFRELVQRAINYMENKDQLDLIIKFAQIECQSGDLERAKTMFESALRNFPKRTDIWSIYLDMMIKYGLKKGDEGLIKKDSIESIRLLFEKATDIKVKEKKIRFIFQKYIDFERQYGDEEKIAAINKKMTTYVDANDIVN